MMKDFTLPIACVAGKIDIATWSFEGKGAPKGFVSIAQTSSGPMLGGQQMRGHCLLYFQRLLPIQCLDSDRGIVGLNDGIIA